MNNALLVIDVQESFRQRPIWAQVSTPDLVEKVNRLVAVARAAGDPVFWIRHSEPGSGGVFDPTNGFVRLIDGLAVAEDDPVVTKTSINSFTTTNLQQQLTSRGIGRLTVCGIRTEQCCETTTRIAADLGYPVTFVTEATATFPIPHHSTLGASLAEQLADPRTLGVKEVMNHTEHVLATHGFATIQTVAELELG